MAIISSSVRFTLGNLNLNELANYDSTLFNNVFEVFRGVTYEDVLTLRTSDESGANLAGTGFVLDDVGAGVSGTVHLVQGVGPGDQTIFSITGLTIGIFDLDAAIASGTFYDDLIIWRAQFSGIDTMTFSNSNDNMRGFGGGDTMNGRGGSDRLKGDSGNDILNGGNGNDVLIGGSGRDFLSGDAGKDRLKGVGGSDVFIFSDGGGKDKILDFDANNNREDIDLSAVTNIEDFSDLTSNHMTQVGDNVVIDDGDNLIITLMNVDIADLNNANFVF